MAHPPDAGGSSVRAGAERDSCRNQNPLAALPIFIHSSWRASHTWFWLKFRAHPSTLCFYEPFHESLATLTRSDALSLGPNSWDSRHPGDEPYFREFVPLIRKAGGVRLFVPQVPYRWFLPVDGPTGHLRREEIKYLALLVRHAERLRRIPVFGFTRSLGRLAAIKNQFPGIHIFQYRNVWTQWISLIGHKQNGNKYFFDQIFRVMLEANDTYLLSIINRYVVRYLQYLPYLKTSDDNNICVTIDDSLEKFTTKLLEVINEHDLFCLYMAFHTYLYMLARQIADIVIDITKVARDASYNQRTRAELKSVTGLSITFDDLSEIQQCYSFDPALINWKEIRDNVTFAALMLDHAFDHRELLRYGFELIDEARAEIETSEKYVAKARDEITKLTSERESITAAKSALATELVRVADQRDAALAERNRVAQQHAVAMAEMNRLAGELHAAKADGKELITENARLGYELASAKAVKEELITENTWLGSSLAAAIASGNVEASTMAALRTELSQLARDRDRVAAQSERWFNAAVVWAAGRLLSAPRSRRGRWFHRVMLRFRAGPMGCWMNRANHKDSPRNRANRAREAREWELAARFYVDELNRNVYDTAIWIQLGHALKEAGKTSAAEIAYHRAATLSEVSHSL